MLSRLTAFAKFTKPLGARSITHVHRPGEGQTKRVTLIPGSGIGPDLTNAVQRVFEAANAPIQWDVIENFSFDKPQCRELLKMNPTIMLGVVKSIKNESKYVANFPLYKYLNMYANVMHAFSIPGVEMRHKKVDVVIIRENTEGEYSGVEHEVYPGVAASLKIMTKPALTRIAEYAFEFAYMTGRKKVTAVHKANIMKLADGLFLQCTREVAKKYPFIKYEEMIIDNCAMQLVKNPWQFDVMVLPNLYGSLVQNIAAGITGGCGLTAGTCLGRDYQLFSQGTRHTGNDIIGKNKANPTAILFASVLMLRSLGLPRFAELVDSSITKTLTDKAVRTPDIGGHNTTTEYVDEIIKNLIEIQKVSRC